DGLVRVLEERAANERRCLVREPALAVERLEGRPPLTSADLEGLGAERGRRVAAAGPILEGDEVGRYDAVGALDVRVQRLVPDPDERAPRQRAGPPRATPRGGPRARP